MADDATRGVSPSELKLAEALADLGELTGKPGFADADFRKRLMLRNSDPRQGGVAVERLANNWPVFLSFDRERGCLVVETAKGDQWKEVCFSVDAQTLARDGFRAEHLLPAKVALAMEFGGRDACTVEVEAERDR